MIIERIIDVWIFAIDFVINMLPENVVETIATISPPEFISWAMCFFPSEVVVFAISIFTTSYLIFLTWAIIEWVYKKIPGVN